MSPKINHIFLESRSVKSEGSSRVIENVCISFTFLLFSFAEGGAWAASEPFKMHGVPCMFHEFVGGLGGIGGPRTIENINESLDFL